MTEKLPSSESEVIDDGGLAGTGVRVEDSDVKVQWDTERSPRPDRLDHRSIQVGVRDSTWAQWIEDWVITVEDVTCKAKRLKAALDAEPAVSEQDLLRQGLLPQDKPFEVPGTLRDALGIS